MKPVAADRSLGFPAGAGEDPDIPPSCVNAMPVKFMSFLASNLLPFMKLSGSDLPFAKVLNHSYFS